MTARMRPCDRAFLTGRLRKASQFMDSAEVIREFAGDEEEIGDAFVTLCVHAGIAASDVICCADLGYYASAESHDQAVRELSNVRPDGKKLGGSLRTVLGMKTRAGYTARSVTATDRKRAWRHASNLLEEARVRAGQR